MIRRTFLTILIGVLPFRKTKRMLADDDWDGGRPVITFENNEIARVRTFRIGQPRSAGSIDAVLCRLDALMNNDKT